MIEEVFLPDLFVHSLHDLDLVKLKKAGIRVLILDIDNTLLASHEKKVTDKERRLIQKIKDQGIEPVAISNNLPQRTQKIAQALSVDCIYFALKPSPKGFRKVLRHCRADKSECAVVGDQLLTDILGGNLAGMYTILTEPLGKDNIFGFFGRIPERRLIRRFKKKRLWKEERAE